MSRRRIHGTELGGRASVHALMFGLLDSVDIGSMYVPFARGMKNGVLTVPSEEFTQCSKQANSYANKLSLRSWDGLTQWLDILFEWRQTGGLERFLTFEDIQVWFKRAGRSDYKYWEIPMLTEFTDLTIHVQGMTLQEIIQQGVYTRPFQFFMLLIDLVLFGFPMLDPVVRCLRLEKIIGLYVRSRLFQGRYDLDMLQLTSEDIYASSFIPLDEQDKAERLENLTLATSVMELENMLHKTTVVGNDGLLLFALARGNVHTLFGKTSTREYLHYLSLCEKIGVNPVGFKYYQEIVHPISHHPSYNSFVDYSF